MNERERYLFDLEGYVVIPSIINATELAQLVAEVHQAGMDDVLSRHGYVHAGFPRDYYDDASWTGDDGYRYVQETYMLDWGPAIRSLVAHPRLIPYLRALIGPRFRLDHSYGVFARGATASHALHNGGSPFDPTQAYSVRDDQMFNSMVVVQFALTDVGPDDGGFCCVPGSHKSNFVLPKEFVDLDQIPDELGARVKHVPMRAGDAVIFTEAVTHGAQGWRGQHDRMALLYKYCHGSMQWERDSPFVSPGHSWTETQSRTLAGPYEGGRPSFEQK